MFDEVNKQRCARHQPILPDAIAALAADAPAEVRGSLHNLATQLGRRTTLRPEAVTVVAVGQALGCLLRHMLDRQQFSVRHETALRHLGVIRDA